MIRIPSMWGNNHVYVYIIFEGGRKQDAVIEISYRGEPERAPH